MQIKLKSENLKINWLCDVEHICWLLLFLGFALRMFYAVQVNYYYSPHDLGTLNIDGSITSSGHLSYIQYLYLQRRIPDTYVGQLYHPPLFHLIGAIVLALFHVTDNYETAFEAMQMLNMFFSTVGVIYGYRIIQKIGKKDWSLIIATSFLNFCPIFYIIGAELNNDCLVTVFMIMAIYYTLCWREKQSVGTIFKIALCIGLGMLAKTSGALIAFAVGMIFLYTLIENHKEWKRYVKQFAIFGIVCIPLGLCWNIYRSLEYGVSLNFIPKLSVDSPQFVGNVSALKRLGLPSARQLTSYCIDWDWPTEYSNIWGQTILTMNFDEGILQIDGQAGEMLAIALLWVSILLSILLFILIFQSLFSSKVDIGLKILFPVNFLIIYSSFVKFAFDYPHICTMNFRYIVIVQVFLITNYVICHKQRLMGIVLDRCVTILVVAQSFLATYLYFFYAV